MTEALSSGKTLPALITDVARLSVVTSLVNILQMAGREGFQAVRAGELLLVVVFRRDVVHQGLLPFEIFTTMGAGVCGRLKVQLQMSLQVTLGTELFPAFIAAVNFLFGMCF